MTYKIPDTLAIIASVLALFVALTWVVPSGEYERTTANGKTVVVPNSYHRVEQVPQGIGALFLAPIRGFMQAGQIIVFVLFIGGAFGVLDATGAIEKGLKKIISASLKRPVIKKMFIPFLMVIFSVAGATFGLSEENLIFILLTIPIAISLGYDSIVGVAIPFVGSGVGFAGAITNPFTIGIAQGIAEVPIFSGWEYRLIVWLVMTTAAIAFVMWYAAKVAANPSYSPMFEIDQARDRNPDTKDIPMDWAQFVVILGFFTVIVLLIVGVNLWNWNIDEISALFLGLAVFAALVTRLPVQKTIDHFLKGMKDMIAAALIIAFSKGILIVLSDGK
ncbi:MAG: YfcC family protein, partial [Cytophagales bacterium]|nr:YfcC family protein [Cytophagales bacterium]